MLILTRTLNQSIHIGPDIVLRSSAPSYTAGPCEAGPRSRVELISIVGNQVRLGIHAPKEVRVDREEVYRQRQQVELSSPSD
jgi:sRNA-binding carbon storage regulator CsrA